MRVLNGGNLGRNKVANRVNDAVDKGARLLMGGER